MTTQDSDEITQFCFNSIPEALVALWSASILPISVGHLLWLPIGPCILLGLLMFLGIGSSWIFDKKSSKGAERGYLYKILAILNAVCALLYSFSQMKGLVPESVDVSMTWIIVVICWGVAVASYFIGDKMTRRPT